MKIIKTNESLLLTSNNKLEDISNLSISDEIVLDKVYHVTDLKESIKTGYKIDTLYSTPVYGFRDSLIRARKEYDFEEEYEFQELSLSSLSKNDYLFFPYTLQRNIKHKFNVSDYLYKSVYNYSIAKQDLISKINLPSWFLYSSLLCGVPEHEEYNKTLDNYLKLNKYESIEEFKEVLIKNNSNKISKNLDISKSVLDLIVLSITDSIKFSSHLTVELSIDTTLYSDMTQNIILFLTKNKLSFKLYNDIYKKDVTIIKASSSFLYLMLQDCFDDYSILFLLTSKQKSYIYNRLFSSYLTSFSFKNELHSLVLQQFFYSIGLLFNTLLNTQNEFLLTPLPDDYYIKLDTGFLVPIINISEIDDSLIELTLKISEA